MIKMLLRGLLFVYITGCAASIETATNIYNEDICEAEIFEGQCESGHVMKITSAVYGRMELGRCIRTDYGSIGCSGDVLSFLDDWCTGRPSCHVRVPNWAFHELKPCPRDLPAYLHVAYACLPEYGCDDVVPPDYALTHRNGNITVITCIEPDDTWTLVCQDHTWLGDIGTCPEV